MEPGPSNSVRRKCLICGSLTSSCHLGVDACRACTVFYRRTRNRKTYACRSNTRKCAQDADGALACKRCRFDRFERILKESGAKELMDSAKSVEREAAPMADDAAAAVAASSPEASQHSPSAERLSNTPSISSSTFSSVSPGLRRERPLLDKCKLYYRLLSSMRRNCELSARANGPHPLEMAERDYPIFPATHSALNAATKIALAGVLEFAGNLFPEIEQFSKEEKWKLAVSFFYRYQGFDSCFRAEKRFPNDLDKSFGSYTCYYDYDVIDGFFDCDYVKGSDLEEAKKFMRDTLDLLARPGRQAITRANPDDDEFHAVLVILFWFTDATQVRDEIVHIGEKYKSAVLQDLHAHYREDLGLNDYASRVGQLFTLILHFEGTKDIKEHFEICRMMNIFKDDTFMYQLQKE
ncbi:hypothetical protein PMAYCL1PPCAC_16667 [Pristionchus mayeri]|uniref:Nuclear receptor domain-containing protein n=1 Tax=Pristionchus mayeri TaxID=1317129 RepID=A0AAN5CL60_9BILA|nr:hypothetical protein PMAYCL1PPCAC_16667 [Pristionchus mayeri]